MAVTCTSTSGMLRVVYTAFEDATDRREAVCYLRPSETGQIDILYSHHTDYNRPGPKGQWETPHDFKMALSPSVMAEISANVMYEYWNAFGHRIKDLPRGSEVPVPYREPSGGMKYGR